MPYKDLSEDDLVQKAKDCLKLALEAEQDQRDRERDDLRFQVPEEQWPEEARRSRQGGDHTPARPMLSIPKLEQPIQLVLNQERAAHLGVNIHPISEDSKDDTAEVIQGLYRAIERNSPAKPARTWAFQRAVLCGRGFYRVNTVYDDSTPDPDDQCIVIERILHQDTVFLDPAAQKPDYSDGEWALLVSWMPLEKFKALYPKARVGVGPGGFAEAARDEPSWIKGTGEKDGAMLVAEYFYKVHDDYKRTRLKGGGYKRTDELTEGDEYETTDKGEPLGRDYRETAVKWCKLTSFEVLERGDWNGKYIPIIPVFGRELQPYDAERRWQGMIGPAKDSQRVFNYAVSNAVEIVALEPKAPWIMSEGQDEGYEDEWQQSNTRNLPVLHYRPKTIGDTPAPPPQRSQVDAGRLGPSMQLIQLSDGWLQVSTATFDPSLGRMNQKERSGKAILALQEQGDAGNSHFMHNLADISMNYEAKVVLDLIPKIYDRPGRIARILDEEDESESVMLNQPYFSHPKTGRPIPLNDEGRAAMAAMQSQPEVKNYDLAKGRYGVTVSIGKSYQSRLQQGAEDIGEILTAQPNLGPVILPLYFQYRDFPGAREMGDLLKKVRDHQMPFLNEDQEQPSPEQAQVQIQQLSQQMQMMQQQLQAAMMELKTEQAKQQAQIYKAQLDSQTQIQKAQLDSQTKLAIAQGKAAQESEQAQLDRQHEAQAAQFQAAHEVAKAAQGAAIAPADLNYRTPAKQPLGGEGDEV